MGWWKLSNGGAHNYIKLLSCIGSKISNNRNRCNEMRSSRMRLQVVTRNPLKRLNALYICTCARIRKFNEMQQTNWWITLFSGTNLGRRNWKIYFSPQLNLFEIGERKSSHSLSKAKLTHRRHKLKWNKAIQRSDIPRYAICIEVKRLSHSAGKLV